MHTLTFHYAPPPPALPPLPLCPPRSNLTCHCRELAAMGPREICTLAHAGTCTPATATACFDGWPASAPHLPWRSTCLPTCQHLTHLATCLLPPACMLAPRDCCTLASCSLSNFFPSSLPPTLPPSPPLFMLVVLLLPFALPLHVPVPQFPPTHTFSPPLPPPVSRCSSWPSPPVPPPPPSLGVPPGPHPLCSPHPPPPVVARIGWYCRKSAAASSSLPGGSGTSRGRGGSGASMGATHVPAPPFQQVSRDRTCKNGCTFLLAPAPHPATHRVHVPPSSCTSPLHTQGARST